MIHVDFNEMGGFLINPALMIPQSNLLDRGKIALLSGADFSLKNIDDWIWMIPLDRKVIPRDFPSGNLPSKIKDLAARLESVDYEEVSVSHGDEVVGGGIRFATMLLNIDFDIEGASWCKGPTLVFKRLF